MKPNFNSSAVKTKDLDIQVEEVTSVIPIHPQPLLEIMEGYHGSDIGNDLESSPVRNGKRLTLFGKDSDQHTAEAFRIGLELYEQDKKRREIEDKSRFQFVLNKAIIAILTETEADAAADITETFKKLL